MKTFIKILDYDNNIKDVELIEDNNFMGGYQVIFENVIMSIEIVDVIK